MVFFYDVDTQKDFMDNGGTLYVPGAEELKPILRKLTDYAIKNDIYILGSVDRHFSNDDELNIFPKHCMNKTEGQKKIPETSRYEVTVESKLGPFGNYIEFMNNEIYTYTKSTNHIIFEKQHTDIFTNRNFKKFLDKLRVDTVVVYGVATEYCVKDAVMGFLDLGIEVYLVDDAIKGINEEEGIKAIEEMTNMGARLVSYEEVLAGEIDGGG